MKKQLIFQLYICTIFKGWKLIFYPVFFLFFFSNDAQICISISEVMGLIYGGFQMNNQAAWWMLAKWLKHSSKHFNWTPGLASDYYQLHNPAFHSTSQSLPHDCTSTCSDINTAWKKLFVKKGRALESILPSHHARRAVYQGALCWGQVLHA